MKLISNTDGRQSLPVFESEEYKYKLKCRDLKRRIQEIDEYNELMTVSIDRTKRAIQRLRLERALLLEKLEEKTDFKADDDSDVAISPPPSPIQHELLKKHASGTLPSTSRGHGKGSGKSRKSKDSLKDKESKSKFNGEIEDEEGKEDYEHDEDHHEYELDDDYPHDHGLDHQDTINHENREIKEETEDIKPSTISEDHDHNDTSTAIHITSTRSKPKKPRNAFSLFCEAERENIIAEYTEQHSTEDINESDITHELATAWKGMGSKSRSYYYEKYEAEKARYEREKAEYEAYAKEQRQSDEPQDQQLSEVVDTSKDAESDVQMEDITEAKPDQGIEYHNQASVDAPAEASPSVKTETIPDS